MKRKNIISMAIVPVVVFATLAFTNLQPGKGNKGEDKGKSEQSSKKGKDQSSNKEHGNSQNSNNHSQGNQEKNNSNRDNHSQGNKQDRENNQGHGNKNVNHGNSNKMNSGNDDHVKMNHGNGNADKLNGKRDNIDWNLNDFSNRKNPKDAKKVTICHNPSGDGSKGVTITVSENALKAHMNHGDKMGDCNINYSDRWSSNYIKSRENVYNTYEQTYERMSYGEALVRLAADKIFGIRSNLDRNRTTLSPSEIQRREALILELENNQRALDSQLGVTRQRLDSDVNIIIKL